MAAVQVLASASTTIVAAANYDQTGVVQNLGPNPIYVARDRAATVAGGVQVASGQSLAFTINNAETLNAIAATADQVSPADTRFEVSEVTR